MRKMCGFTGGEGTALARALPDTLGQLALSLVGIWDFRLARLQVAPLARFSIPASCVVSPAGTEVADVLHEACGWRSCGLILPFLLPRQPGSLTRGRISLLLAKEAVSEEEKFASYVPKGG